MDLVQGIMEGGIGKRGREAFKNVITSQDKGKIGGAEGSTV